MAAITEVLSRNGLRMTERRFAELVAQSLAELGGPAVADPANELSQAEQDALHAVTADLSPLRPREADPRAPGAAAYAALLADAVPVAVAASRLGIDPSRVRHRLARRDLLGIRQPRGWLLPAYQFVASGGLLPGLEKVSRAIADVHPVVAARFFATATAELVVDRKRLTPRQWLEGGGDPQRVVALARSLDLLP